jgi:uncharacterized membrane protein
MNPFDLKAVFLARHAQHVALVHFPIALIFVGALFDLLSLREQSLALLRAAYYTVIVAAISAFPTIITGVLAWQLQFEGKGPKGNLKLHMMLALCSTVVIWLVCWLHVKAQRDPRPNSTGLRLAIEAVAVALTLLTAHVGGFVSGVNGPV